jgi:hypothetical protein
MEAEGEGDKFDAGVTGREVHLSQEKADLKLAITGLSRAVVWSELRRELFSPSGAADFRFKLKVCNKLPGELLLYEF